MLRLISNRKLTTTRERQSHKQSALFLPAVALCISWGDLTPFPGKQHLLQASGCRGTILFNGNQIPEVGPGPPGQGKAEQEQGRVTIVIGSFQHAVLKYAPLVSLPSAMKLRY